MDLDELVNEFYINNHESFCLEKMPGILSRIVTREKAVIQNTTEFDDYKVNVEAKRISYDKSCSNCKNVLPSSEFRVIVTKNKPAIQSSWCKGCECKASAERRNRDGNAKRNERDMTPKEKAKEIIDKFKDIEIGSEGYHSWGMTDCQLKQAAIIAVDEIILISLEMDKDYGEEYLTDYVLPGVFSRQNDSWLFI